MAVSNEITMSLLAVLYSVRVCVCVACTSFCTSCLAAGPGFCDAGMCVIGYRRNAALTCEGTPATCQHPHPCSLSFILFPPTHVNAGSSFFRFRRFLAIVAGYRKVGTVHVYVQPDWTENSAGQTTAGGFKDVTRWLEY